MIYLLEIDLVFFLSVHKELSVVQLHLLFKDFQVYKCTKTLRSFESSFLKNIFTTKICRNLRLDGISGTKAVSAFGVVNRCLNLCRLFLGHP